MRSTLRIASIGASAFLFLAVAGTTLFNRAEIAPDTNPNTPVHLTSHIGPDNHGQHRHRAESETQAPSGHLDIYARHRSVSDNQTDISGRDTKQVAPKPTIMILGSMHLWKLEYDVLLPQRQREIEEVVRLLKEFRPTKITVEVDPSKDARENAFYHGYLEGTYELQAYEGDQIGYRLAKQFGHPKIYCIDYWPDNWPSLAEIDQDYNTFAQVHNQEHFFTPPDTTGKEDEHETYESMLDTYKRINQPEWNLDQQQGYLRMARIGLDDQYPGANWVAHSWYARNLKIFVNVTRITESADDRILVIIGAGHTFLLQQFLEDSGDYIVESPLKYLH